MVQYILRNLSTSDLLTRLRQVDRRCTWKIKKYTCQLEVREKIVTSPVYTLSDTVWKFHDFSIT